MEILTSSGPLIIQLPAIMILANIMFKALKQCSVESNTPTFSALKPMPADTSPDQAFLLRLAIEVDELRQMHGSNQPLHCTQAMCQTSLELADTILAMNGYNPHPGEIFEEDEAATAEQLSRHIYT